ncbi:hypothetical protein [Salinicola halophyticus]|uniref:hypothetical protein n=1 Tax=Salinicola halophyticus TaxID=1808881 RepID=UPI003F469A0C
MFTVITGVFIFVVSQLLMKFVIDPAVELKREIAGLTNTFLRRSSSEDTLAMTLDTALELRVHAATLMQCLWSVPMYKVTTSFWTAGRSTYRSSCA